MYSKIPFFLILFYLPIVAFGNIILKENSKRKLKVEEKLEQSLVLVGCLNEELINKITKLNIKRY